MTEADLYEGDWNFLFGLSNLPGPASVMSLARLRSHHGTPAQASALLRERAAKMAIHELGHAAGLRHCPNEGCVMYLRHHGRRTGPDQPAVRRPLSRPAAEGSLTPGCPLPVAPEPPETGAPCALVESCPVRPACRQT